MSDYRPTVVERALQLARSGDFPSPDHVIRALGREGYDQPRLHLEGRVIKALMREAFREGRAARGADERSVDPGAASPPGFAGDPRDASAPARQVSDD